MGTTMGTFTIALSLILVSNLYKPFIKYSKITSTIRVVTIYLLSAFSLAFAGLYFTYESASGGEVFVFVLCMIGATVRVGYYHFRSARVATEMQG